jgi:ubiquinone/menaquinone biosynthesis C-methylase UbiE
MLHRYLHQWALELDERAFRVVLKDGVDDTANRNFFEGPSAIAAIDRAITDTLAGRLAAAGIRPAAGERVIDVCCGRGHLGEWLRREYGARVTFADLSVAQLTELVQRVNHAHGPAADASVADLLRMPYRSDTFDLVVGNSFLHHVRDVPAAMAELFRITKPGGRLALLHEPNLNASFWESFPLSLLKNTSPIAGFTDLWLFHPDDLVRLAVQAGFVTPVVQGTGVASGVLINWYLILLGKLAPGWARGFVAGYHLRRWLNNLEYRLRGGDSGRRAPSLMITAAKPV